MNASRSSILIAERRSAAAFLPQVVVGFGVFLVHRFGDGRSVDSRSKWQRGGGAFGAAVRGGSDHDHVGAECAGRIDERVVQRLGGGVEDDIEIVALEDIFERVAISARPCTVLPCRNAPAGSLAPEKQVVDDDDLPRTFPDQLSTRWLLMNPAPVTRTELP
jgi:hypothetical protein